MPPPIFDQYDADGAFIEWYLHAPYVIAVRSASMSARELLRALGLERAQPGPDPYRRDIRAVYVLRDDSWIMAADDWYYSLWHDSEKPRRLAQLAGYGEVFAFAMGDACASYDYWRFREGRLIRRRVVESPHYSDRIVTIDEGPPAAVETEALYSLDAALIRERMFEALGIRVARMRVESFIYPEPST